ncbi:CBS domain-containing protein CBSCBSPB1 [Hibiscus syriacus]|uniref:CBS domain-containing protein CBSCBSPB1 n=1 Tax=Hibiscus syriacus TaxID=106335 RepID=A0A6A2ZBH1_HIBSY|nr:CBS domain-containing protein CBSCBSPB1 [Hibiscus syriacus]
MRVAGIEDGELQRFAEAEFFQSQAYHQLGEKHWRMEVPTLSGNSYHHLVLLLSGERTVKRLRLSKAVTVPESTTIYEASRRMAARKLDVLLLTDSNALLCGIFTDKQDIATRVIAQELNMEETPVSKVMTKNPVFVLSDTLSVEALQKMVQGKFRHLPVVQNGEVIALLDIAKCLYDAIARMERSAEKGKAIAAAVEGVEKNWGTSFSGQNTLIQTLKDHMFRPSLSTIISDNPKIATVSPADTVLTTAKKMLECRANSAVVTIGNKPWGILTSKDILMRVIAHNLPPETTSVEKVMTPNPACATLNTPIVHALKTMHDGNFLHLPVVDRDGEIVAVVDVLHVTRAAVATVGQVGKNFAINNETTTTTVQKFWDSAMALPPIEDEDETRSYSSVKFASEVAETERSLPCISSNMPYTFGFKIQDKRGRMHRFICDTRSLTNLISAVLRRLGDDRDRKNVPQILYEDEDRDKVVMESDYDLQVAVEHAKLVGLKVRINSSLCYVDTCLKLHCCVGTMTMESIPYKICGAQHVWKHRRTFFLISPPLFKWMKDRRQTSNSRSSDYANPDAWTTAYNTVAAGAAVVAGLGLLAYLRKAGN